MSGFVNPFLQTRPAPGTGEIHVRLLPPRRPVIGSLSFTYPLKLIPSTPHILNDETRQKGSEDTSTPLEDPSLPPESVPLVFLLSYGGGLLPPDSIELQIRLDAGTRLAIATQGSTKIYPSHVRVTKPDESPSSPSSTTSTTLAAAAASASVSLPSRHAPELPTARQTLRAHLAAHSALCLTPDPTQPFRGSKYAQLQSFTLHPAASLLLLDWTVEGRRARGESWDALTWRGCNEIWREQGDDDDEEEESGSDPEPESDVGLDSGPELGLGGKGDGDGSGVGDADGAQGTRDGESGRRRRRRRGARRVRPPRLQLRDAVILEADGHGLAGARGDGMRALKEGGTGCFGTLVAVGRLVEPVGDFFVEEFGALPRVGARKWDDDEEDEAEKLAKMLQSQTQDAHPDVLRKAKRLAWRQRRLKMEKEGGVLWNAARVRGLVICKFIAKDLQSARHWLNEMLVFEGTAEREFGPGSLMSLR